METSASGGDPLSAAGAVPAARSSSPEATTAGFSSAAVDGGTGEGATDAGSAAAGPGADSGQVVGQAAPRASLADAGTGVTAALSAARPSWRPGEAPRNGEVPVRVRRGDDGERRTGDLEMARRRRSSSLASGESCPSSEAGVTTYWAETAADLGDRGDLLLGENAVTEVAGMLK